MLPLYDPMIAKLIVWDVDREASTQRMLRALGEYEIERPEDAHPLPPGAARDRAVGARRDLPRPGRGQGVAEGSSPSRAARSQGDEAGAREGRARLRGRGVRPALRREGDRRGAGSPNGAGAGGRRRRRRRRGASARAAAAAARPGELVSPIQGTVLKVAVEKGAEVDEGALICVIEAMKMENEITAPSAGHRRGAVGLRGRLGRHRRHHRRHQVGRCPPRWSSGPGSSARRWPTGSSRDGWEVTLVDAFEPGDPRSESGGETRMMRFSHGADRLYTELAYRSLVALARARRRCADRGGGGLARAARRRLGGRQRDDPARRGRSGRAARRPRRRRGSSRPARGRRRVRPARAGGRRAARRRRRARARRAGARRAACELERARRSPRRAAWSLPTVAASRPTTWSGPAAPGSAGCSRRSCRLRVTRQDVALFDVPAEWATPAGARAGSTSTAPSTGTG